MKRALPTTEICLAPGSYVLTIDEDQGEPEVKRLRLDPAPAADVERYLFIQATDGDEGFGFEYMAWEPAGTAETTARMVAAFDQADMTESDDMQHLVYYFAGHYDPTVPVDGGGDYGEAERAVLAKYKVDDIKPAKREWKNLRGSKQMKPVHRVWPFVNTEY